MSPTQSMKQQQQQQQHQVMEVPLGDADQNGSTKSASDSSSSPLSSQEEGSARSFGEDDDLGSSFADLNDMNDDDDDNTQQHPHSQNPQHPHQKAKKRLSESMRLGAGEDEIELEQTQRVELMRRWFYVTALLSGVTGFLLTYFLIDKSSEWEDVEIPPAVFAIISPLFILLITLSLFRYYDRSVEERHETLSMNAQRTGHIVASLFPKVVQRRIWADAAAAQQEDSRNKKYGGGGGGANNGHSSSHTDTKRAGMLMNSAHQYRSMANLLPTSSMHQSQHSYSVTGKMTEFLDDEKPSRPEQRKKLPKTKPIADLFPEATVFFGDLVGFTAWSSMREPSQVFTLLEAIYNEFDEIARRRRVFKVETVGDCYVAVAGLPEPCLHHAQVMARFAWDCRLKMNDLVKELEVTLDGIGDTDRIA